MYCKPPKRHPKTGGSQLYIWGLSFGYLSLSGKLGIHWCDFPHTFGAKLWLPNLCFFWLFLDWFLETLLVRIQVTLGGAFSPKKWRWASLWVWSLGVFFLPLFNLWGLQSFVSPISQRATVVSLVKNQLTIRSKRLLYNKRKTQSWRNLGCLGTCQIRFKRKRKLLHI